MRLEGTSVLSTPTYDMEKEHNMSVSHNSSHPNLELSYIKDEE